MFADLRHVPAWPENASMLLDACFFSHPDNSSGFHTPAQVSRNFDNPVRPSGSRAFCPSELLLGR